MGIEEEANRTLFIRNLDQRVTEELLFELFLQAGPLSKTKIPKDNDGKRKTFGFAVYKDEGSVPYALKLLDGTALFGRTIHVQPRTGSTVNTQTSSPGNTPNPHGQWAQGQMNSPPYSPQVQRSSLPFGSPDSMQKQVMMSNIMLQIQMTQMQQLQQQNGSLLGPAPQQRQQFASGGGGGGGGYGGSSNGGGGGQQQQQQQQQHDSDSSRQHSSQMNTSSGHYSRGQRYADEQGSGGRHQQQQHGRGGYHGYHDSKGGNNYQGNRGSSRHSDDRSDNRGYQDSRRRRY